MNKFIKQILAVLFCIPGLAMADGTVRTNQWTMVTIPLAQFSTSNMFNAEQSLVYETDWVAFTYDSQSNQYTLLSDGDAVIPGTSAWVMQLSGETLELAFGLSDGNDDSCIERGDCKLNLPLTPGSWHMVGSPIGTATLGSDYSTIIGGTTLGLNIEGRDDAIGFRWNLNTNAYEQIEESTLLYPYEGFWAYLLEDNTATATSIEMPRYAADSGLVEKTYTPIELELTAAFDLTSASTRTRQALESMSASLQQLVLTSPTDAERIEAMNAVNQSRTCLNLESVSSEKAEWLLIGLLFDTPERRAAYRWSQSNPGELANLEYGYICDS